MKYITSQQASKEWKISQRRVQILCSQGRIKGAFKLGEVWAIPSESKKPKDSRIKNKKEEL